MSRRHLVANRDQLLAFKLDQFPAAGAVQVIVLGVSVVVVEDGAAVELETVEQPRVDALAERAVDRRRADVVRFTAPGKPFDQFFGVKVVVLAEDLVDQKLPLTGLTQAARLQIFGEPLFGRQRHFERRNLGRDRVGC